MKKLVPKEGKKQHFWAKPRGGTGTETGWYRYHHTEPIWYQTSGTSTTIPNVFGTGTKHSGTGTTMSKSPDF